jgi:lysophospholipid acyltransferase (LPLAT)-like uncharacterized protein
MVARRNARKRDDSKDAMKRLGPSLNRAIGFLTATAVRAWMSTLDYKVAFYDPAVDPVDPQYDGAKIYVFWHENILMPLYLRGHCNLAMLLSRHRDADILSETARQLGFEFVRGSTFGGGSSAIRELLRRSRWMNLTITPDGPRGPRRRLAQGSVYLASKLGLPLVLLGMGYDHPWRMQSWDRFALPRPFSRSRAVVSPAITIPPDLDRDGLEHHRQRIENLLSRLTDEAEAWAVAGTPKIGQVTVRPNRVWRGPKLRGTKLSAEPPGGIAISRGTTPDGQSGRGQAA